MSAGSSFPKTAALGVIPVIVLSLIFGVYLSSVVTTTTSSVSVTTVSQSSSSSCSTSFPYDTSHPISVLVLTSGSSGTICVEYINSLNNSASFSSDITVNSFSSGSAANVSSQFQVNASPSSLNFTPSANPSDEVKTVTYTVSVSSNATGGIYGITLLQFCSPFPLVVVPSNSSSLMSLNSSEFSSWYPHEGSCPAQLVNSRVIGVGEFKVVSVP